MVGEKHEVKPHTGLVRFPLDDLLGPGIVRETEFRSKLDKVDWNEYQDKMVMIPWIHDREIPFWAYMMTVAKLANYAAVVSYGEACSPTILYRKRRNHEPVKSGNLM